MNALLIITSAILFLACLNLWLWYLKRIAKLQKQQPAPGKFSNDLAALNAGSIGLGERLLKIERQQKILAEQLDQVQKHDRNNLAYNQAVDLIKRGINKKDLMESCELSEAEAGLLMVMHDKKMERKAARH